MSLILHFRIAIASSLLETPVSSYAWLITEEALPMQPLVTNVTMVIEDHVPKSVLAVDGHETWELPNIMQNVLRTVR